MTPPAIPMIFLCGLSWSAQRIGSFNLSLTVPRYTNGRASDLNSLQEIIHVSRLSFFTHSLTRSFFVSSLKERNYTYSMYLSTVKVGPDFVMLALPTGASVAVAARFLEAGAR